MVSLIASACAAAMEQCLINQDGPSPLKATELVSEGMTVFTLKEESESFAGLQLEFDVVPVLQVIGGKFLLLSKDGRLVPTSTQLAAHTISVNSQTFPGLREMMVVPKQGSSDNFPAWPRFLHVHWRWRCCLWCSKNVRKLLIGGKPAPSRSSSELP